MGGWTWRWRAASCATIGEQPGLSLCRTRTVCWLMCLRAKLRFCVESHKGALAFTAPDHCDFAAAQAPTQAAGGTPRFRTHGSRPIATKQEGASRVRPTARRALRAFRKKEGTFRRFSRVFSEKSPVFFCTEPAAHHPGGRLRRRLPTAAKARGRMGRHSAAAATNTPR